VRSLPLGITGALRWAWLPSARHGVLALAIALLLLRALLGLERKSATARLTLITRLLGNDSERVDPRLARCHSAGNAITRTALTRLLGLVLCEHAEHRR